LGPAQAPSTATQGGSSNALCAPSMWLMAKIPVLFRRGQAQEYFLECCPWCGMVPAVSEMRKMFQQSALALCAAVCAAPALHAERFVVDFPTSGIDAPPGGLLAGPVMEWEDPGSRRIDVPLAPTADSQRLVATIVFEEAPGDAIRIWWEPDVPGSPVPIAGEWTDGIRGWNQKSGLIPAELSEQGGNLVFESAGSSRRIHRLILTRLDRGEWFVPEGLAGLEFFRIEGETVGSDDLQGRAWSMPPDAWNGNVIEAHLQEFTESTQGGVEFLVEIRPAPQQAVLRFEMSAADLLPPQVWVNGKPLPNVSMEIPPLRAPTTVQVQSNAGPLFPGWRAAWAHVPAGILLPGENQFLISSGSGEGFVRRARVEMWFSAPVLPAAEPPGDFPDVFSEALDTLPSPDAPPDATEPALPPWDAANGPALETIPAAPDWFRTSLR
jgi:hypothetical protein